MELVTEDKESFYNIVITDEYNNVPEQFNMKNIKKLSQLLNDQLKIVSSNLEKASFFIIYNKLPKYMKLMQMFIESQNQKENKEKVDKYCNDVISTITSFYQNRLNNINEGKSLSKTDLSILESNLKILASPTYSLFDSFLSPQLLHLTDDLQILYSFFKLQFPEISNGSTRVKEAQESICNCLDQIQHFSEKLSASVEILRRQNVEYIGHLMANPLFVENQRSFRYMETFAFHKIITNVNNFKDELVILIDFINKNIVSALENEPQQNTNVMY